MKGLVGRNIGSPGRRRIVLTLGSKRSLLMFSFAIGHGSIKSRKVIAEILESYSGMNETDRSLQCLSSLRRQRNPADAGGKSPQISCTMDCSTWFARGLEASRRFCWRQVFEAFFRPRPSPRCKMARVGRVGRTPFCLQSITVRGKRRAEPNEFEIESFESFGRIKEAGFFGAILCAGYRKVTSSTRYY